MYEAGLPVPDNLWPSGPNIEIPNNKRSGNLAGV